MLGQRCGRWTNISPTLFDFQSHYLFNAGSASLMMADIELTLFGGLIDRSYPTPSLWRSVTPADAW